MPTLSCSHCHREFHLAPAHLARLKRPPTCSQECRTASMRGPGHWRWRGGRYVDRDGYVKVWTPDGYVAEHRLIVQKRRRRKLQPTERVYHSDHGRRNNHPDNLYVVKRRTQKKGPTRRPTPKPRA